MGKHEPTRSIPWTGLKKSHPRTAPFHYFFVVNPFHITEMSNALILRCLFGLGNYIFSKFVTGLKLLLYDLSPSVPHSKQQDS